MKIYLNEHAFLWVVRHFWETSLVSFGTEQSTFDCYILKPIGVIEHSDRIINISKQPFTVTVTEAKLFIFKNVAKFYLILTPGKMKNTEVSWLINP